MLEWRTDCLRQSVMTIMNIMELFNSRLKDCMKLACRSKTVNQQPTANNSFSFLFFSGSRWPRRNVIYQVFSGPRFIGGLTNVVKRLLILTIDTVLCLLKWEQYDWWNTFLCITIAPLLSDIISSILKHLYLAQYRPKQNNSKASSKIFFDFSKKRPHTLSKQTKQVMSCIWNSLSSEMLPTHVARRDCSNVRSSSWA